MSVLKANPSVREDAENVHQPSYNEDSWYIHSGTTPLTTDDEGDKAQRRNDESKEKKGLQRRVDQEKHELSRSGIVPEFTGSAMGVDRHENVLYHVPVDPSGALSFGTWPYPGKGLYGLGYNFKPVAAFVMPILLIAGLGLLYTNVINVARYGRKKRSVLDENAAESAAEGKRRPWRP